MLRFLTKLEWHVRPREAHFDKNEQNKSQSSFTYPPPLIFPFAVPLKPPLGGKVLLRSLVLVELV